MIAISKPSGMVVHRGWATDRTTVYDIVRDQIVGAPVYAVHRLDRGTSGVLVFALDAEAADFIQEKMREGAVRKRYLALVRGPMRDRWFINHPIKQPPSDVKIEAQTEFIPIAHAGRWSLIEARPITGRSHQIRLHLKHISHHLVGDVRHGKGDVNRHFRDRYNFSRLALHAAAIAFPHPDNANTELTIYAELPEDFASLLAQLGINATTGGDAR